MKRYEIMKPKQFVFLLTVVMALLFAENYTLIFNEDGTFNGTADCNNISGTYSKEI